MNQIRTNTNFAKKQNPQTYLNNDKYNNPNSETCMQGFSWWVGGGNWWDPCPLPKKLGYPQWPMSPTVLNQKCWFCNFQAVSGHFAQIDPHQLTRFGKPWHV